MIGIAALVVAALVVVGFIWAAFDSYKHKDDTHQCLK